MGPLWGPGGDRGLYKTTDGGETWEQVLEIDENTGVVDLVMDPRDPDVHLRRQLPAPAPRLDPDQRRSRDRASTRPPTAAPPGRKLDQGPAGRRHGPHRPGHRPRASPTRSTPSSRPPSDKGGFYRSTDRRRELGQAHERLRRRQPAVLQRDLRRSRTTPTASTAWTPSCSVTEDGGKTWSAAWASTAKHVDDHALWIDPRRHRPPADRQRRRRLRELRPRRELALHGQPAGHPVLPGGRRLRRALLQRLRRHPGQQHPGRPVAHALRATASQPRLVHHPRRRRLRAGRRSRQPGHRLLPVAVRQPGALRPRRAARRIDIQPQPERRRDPQVELELAADHQPARPPRLYFAAKKLFRSDDRGDSWTRISGDLTRGIDRNKLEVMGRVWSVDAVAKNNVAPRSTAASSR